MECPRGTLAYGMTLLMPESGYWRDPSLGPPPSSNAPLPISICLLCHRITKFSAGQNREEVETLSAENRNQPSYQVCIGKGQYSSDLLDTLGNYVQSSLLIPGTSNSRIS